MERMLDKESISHFELPLVESENSVSVIIPVYNEERSIYDVIKELQEILSNSHIKYEIIVVDDGSTDRSPEILGNIDGITYIRHSRNIGYGGALKTGLNNAKGNLIVITDGDGTYPNRIIPELIKGLDKYDMVVGARAKNDKNIPLMRRPVKWFLGNFANYLSQMDIPDLNSGLRAFKKDIALRYYKMLPQGFSFTTTITLAMHCNNHKVQYIPIQYEKREGKSKIRPLKETINFIQLIYRTVMYFRPLKVFLPVAGLIFIGFMISSIFDVFVLMDMTEKTLILFLAFIQVLQIGLLADLIVKRNP